MAGPVKVVYSCNLYVDRRDIGHEPESGGIAISESLGPDGVIFPSAANE